MSIKLSSLFFEIGARGDKLLAELTKVEKDTKTWSGKMKKSTKAVTFGFAALTTAAVGYYGATATIYKLNSDQITQQGKLANRLGTTYGKMQVLGLAAREAGVDQEGLNDTLADFTERLGEAAIDGGEPAEALDLLRLSADELRKQDPADALRQVIEAMDELPDAGIRAATGAKLFGDTGIQITGLLAESFDKAEKKIEALGGALSQIEVAQVIEASGAVADIGLAASLSGQRLTAKLAPGVTLVANQLFEASKQGVQLEETIDTLVVSSIYGIAQFSASAANLLSFIEGREEIVNYGVLGYMLFGKKGAAVGVLLGSVSDTIEVNLNSVRSFFGETVSETELLQRELLSLETTLKNSEENISFLGQSAGLAINNLFYPSIEELNIGIENVEHKLSELGDGRDSGSSFVSGLAEVMRQGSEAAFTLAENYGKVNDTLEGTDNLRAPVFTPEYSEGAAEKALAANQSFYAADIIEYQLYQDSRNEAAENGTEIRREIFEREFADNMLQNAGLFEAYNELQESQISSLDILAEEQKAQAESTSSFFASQAQEAKQFQQTWTDFNAANSAQRIQIFAQESTQSLAILGQHSKTFFKLHKAVSLADAAVSIATGVSRALELPFPGNLFAAFKVGLAGAAQIATINKAKIGNAPLSTAGLGGGGVTPTQDVSGVTGSVADQVSAPVPAQRSGGIRPTVFTSPGATPQQRAAQVAKALATAAELDLFDTDDEGRPTYTGPDIDENEYSWELAS